MSRIYLKTVLPELDARVSPQSLEITRPELNDLLEYNLSSSELSLVHALREMHDIFNAQRWLEGRPLLNQGTHSPIEYEIALQQEDEKIIPSTVIDFFDQYQDVHVRKKHANELLYRYFSSAAPTGQEEKDDARYRKGAELVSSIIEMEHTSRLIFAFLRNQHRGEEATKAMSHSSASEKASMPFPLEAVEEWPDAYQPLYQIWNECKNDPSSLEKAFFEWKFDYLSRLVSPLNHFGIEHILVFCAQFDLLEARKAMNNASYESVIERISKAKRS